MSVFRNIGTAGLNRGFADVVTPANKQESERTWVDDMYLDRGLERMNGSTGSRGDDLTILERLLGNQS